MTKTNAKTATQTKASKEGVSATARQHAKDTRAAAKAEMEAKKKPHLLTDADKAKGRAKAEKMAGKGKASNQSAILSDADKAQVANEAADRKPRAKKVLGAEDFKGETSRQMKARLNRELEQEAKREGTVRAFDQISISGPHPQSEGFHMVGASANNAVTIPNHKFVGKVAEAAKLGMSFKAFKEIWEAEKKASPGKLAHGLDGRNAPHSAKSVGDRNAAAKGTNKADKVQARKAAETAKKAERKAERAAKAAPKADDNRKITIVDKKFTYGKEGTSRNASWIACTKSKTVADYAKAGGALKYLARWVSAGAIKLG